MGKEYFIGDFLKRTKRPVQIKDDVSYKRITISTKHKGIRLRDEKIGFEIGTKKQFLVKSGDFILSKIDARNGAFGIIPKDLDNAIITGNFWTYIVDNKIVDINWFLLLTNSEKFLGLCKNASTGTTHRKYLDEKIFLNEKIFIPSIEEQKKLVDFINNLKIKHNALLHEIQTQKQLVTQLKQSILQEAIQGKLTADWREQNPDTEPASELLKRIKAEKEKLINEKRIRKEKPLPPITPEEIPFDLPDGWVWCRITELFNVLSTNGKQVKNKDYLDKGNFPIVDQGKKLIGGYSNEKNKLIKLEKPIIIFGDHTKEIKYIDFNFIPGADGTKLLDFYKPQYVKFIFYLLKAIKLENRGYNRHFKILKQQIIPFPPLAEQKAIVEKVESLMQKVSAMEEEIKKSEQNAQMLMQAVLIEAFEDKKKEKTEKV